MKKFILLLCSIATVIFLCKHAYSATWKDGVKQFDITGLCRRLEVDKREDREFAYQELVNMRQYLVQRTLEMIDLQTSKRLDRVYHGSWHMAIRAAGEYRMEEAVVPLVKIIDLHLDKTTFPVGARIRTSSLYPAAEALVRISDRNMIPVLFERIKNSSNEDTIRVCGWVLEEHLGKNMTSQLLKEEADKTASPKAKENLNKLMELMAKIDPLLIYPAQRQ